MSAIIGESNYDLLERDDVFGTAVANNMRELLASSLDPNQISNMLVRSDPKGRDYGIGVVFEGDGRPMVWPRFSEQFRLESQPHI